MFNRILLVVTLVFIVAATGCDKEPSPSSACEDLENALVANNNDEVKAIVTQFINRLPSREYTANNMNRLVSLLAGQCNVSVRADCFNCIKTLPGQTELNLSFIMSGTPVNKTIDISYTSDNKMLVNGMHD